MEELNTTLLLIIKDGKILLPQKKRGFGEGKFNGVGGKIKENESVVNAMIRETKEEINVTPKNYQQFGFTEFYEFYKDKEIKINMTTFVATDYEGDITESEEMKPYWFDINNIPFNSMHPDDKFWLPVLLSGKKFKAIFKIDKNNNILNYEIKETTFDN